MSKTLCAAIRTLLAVFLFATITNAQSDSLAIHNEKLYTLLRTDLKAFAQEDQFDSLALTYEELQAATSQKKATHPIFIFHPDEFWLNLHHFLYVLGRSENKTVDSARTAVVDAPVDQDQGLEKLNSEQRVIWREAVSFYAKDLSKKDAIFDDPLPGITTALAQAGGAKSLKGVSVDAATVAVLERAAPIYRKVWWPKHQAANRAWRSSINGLVDQYGKAILDFITKIYEMTWPEKGFAIHLSAYSNWAGAYSTRGDLLVMSSLHADLRGPYGLETAFHEGMHQWDSQIFQALREQARLLNKMTPRDLSHAMIFFTAGEAVRRTIPGHVPYAEKFGIWQRGLRPFKVPLEETWKPYLDGRGTRTEAIAELIKRTATEPRPQ